MTVKEQNLSRRRQSSPQGSPTRGTEYGLRVESEIEHYSRKFRQGVGRETLLEPAPPVWSWVSDRASRLIQDATGENLIGHVANRLNQRPGVRMLSLGSGTGGVELEFARQCPQAEIHCIDINPELIRLGESRALELALNVRFETADLNTYVVPPETFDIVFCHASLHHIVELEHVARQIVRSLRSGGVLITVDVIARNGFLMWPETREIAAALFRTLPARYRVNHTAYPAPRLDDEIWEMSTSTSTMECIRSEEILSVLASYFVPEHFVPYFSFSRRFLDAMYGPNYDLAQPLDAALAHWLWELDCFYLATGALRPETFFGIFRPALNKVEVRSVAASGGGSDPVSPGVSRKRGKNKPQARKLIIHEAHPQLIRGGEPFNVQPDGRSALAIVGTGITENAYVVFDGLVLESTYGNPSLITAIVPPELCSRPGRYRLMVRDPPVESNEIDFIVEAP